MISPERSQRKGLLIPCKENGIWHSSLLCALLQVHKYETARGWCRGGAGVPFTPPSLSWRLLSIFLPLQLSFLADGEREPFGCEILRAWRCSSVFQGKVNVVNSVLMADRPLWCMCVCVCVHTYIYINICMYAYVCKYTHLLSGAPCPWCMLLGRRQKMVYFVLLTTCHYRQSWVGPRQVIQLTRQFRGTKQLLLPRSEWGSNCFPDCLKVAIPVVLWAALWWDRGFGVRVLVWRHQCPGKSGGTERISEHPPPPFPRRRGPHLLQMDISPLPSWCAPVYTRAVHPESDRSKEGGNIWNSPSLALGNIHDPVKS